MRKYLLFIPLLLLCNSCIEMEQEIWINSNGSGRIRVVMGLKKTLYNLMNMRSDTDIKEQVVQDQKKLQSNSNVTESEIKEYFEGDLWFYSVDVTVKDLRDTKDLQKDLQDIFNFNQKDNPSVKSQINVDKVGFAKFFFTYTFDEKEKTVRNVDKVFEDRSFTFRLHAPHIVSSNGKRNTEENMVEWRFPMADIINRKGAFLPELKAEMQMINVKKMLFFSALLFLILISIYFVYRKKKK